VTTLLLVRHADHDLVGKALAGRNRAVGLNDAGRRQAQALARKLSALSPAAVFTSPQPRAEATACAIATACGMNVRCEPALDEIDFGDWTRRTFRELADDPHWQTWVDRRSIARSPNGESLGEVQLRIVGCLTGLTAAYPERTIVLVSHGDVLKAALAHYLRSSLDELECFDLAPASVSIVAAGAAWAQVRLVNGTID